MSLSSEVDVLIGLIGDKNAEVTAHRAIPLALEIAASQCGLRVGFEWIPTPTGSQRCSNLAESFSGLWCVPASPYQDRQGALRLLQTARERSIPLLGSCGGFQHMALEFAVNKLGLSQADNAEENPAAGMPLIAPLLCSLVEVSDKVILKEPSLLKKIYNTDAIEEKYHCRYGLNRNYLPLFDNTGLTISAVDSEGDPRALEIAEHPFYIGVAFQPERSALSDQSHPLITEFVRHCSSKS